MAILILWGLALGGVGATITGPGSPAMGGTGAGCPVVRPRVDGGAAFPGPGGPTSGGQQFQALRV